MSALPRHARLVDDLVGTLRPVRPLPPPGRRALAWLGTAAALGLALAAVAEAGAPAEADTRWAAAGAVLTAGLAAYAAFATSVPGRSAAWALLPLPAALVWIGASGLGCLRASLAPGAGPAEAQGCLAFLLAASLPLSALMLLMLRRACPLRPGLTAMLGGLATAAAAAALLAPFHPHAVTALDLLIHMGAAGLVVGLNGLAGGRLLAGR